MPIFEEREPGVAVAILVPLLAFLLAFPLWHIGERDLYWSEGDFAAMAMEAGSFPPVTAAHGEIVPNSYPLFPLAASWLSKTGLGMEFSLRFISVAALAGLCAIVWTSCRQAAGLQAAAAGCAMMLSTILVAEKSIDGYPHMLSTFFMFAGWLLWFTYGQSRGNWNAAWILAGLFAGLAFYTTGWEAIIYFSIPLMFMRRPLTIWRRLNLPGFYTGLAILACFILLWGVPRWKAGSDIPFRSMPIDSDVHVGEYLLQLLAFPFETMVRMLPWTLLAWAPFCAAFSPLDKNPLFTRFLRTIFLSLLILLWLSPFTRGRDIIILAAPLATLVGMHYWIAVRRHGDQFLAMIKVAAMAGVIAGAASLVFHLLPAAALNDILPFSRDISYKSALESMSRGIAESAAAMLAGVAAIFICKARKPVWMAMLCVFASAMLVFWSMVNPYKASDRTRSQLGATLRAALGPAASPSLTVYKDFPSGLYSECHYMGCKVRKISSDDEIPKKDKEVYVIASEVPSLPERNWTNLIPEMKYKDRRICLWKGVLKEDDKRGRK